MLQRVKRRDFLRMTMVAGVGALTMGGVKSFAQEAAAKNAPKPDMLIIMPDQMRGDCLSLLDHSVVRTPQLDALAKQGALFRRAYTTVASCIPARYSLLTGLCPNNSGVVGFAAKKMVTPSMPGQLAGVGYSTVLVGRNMHQPKSSGSCGYQKRILGSTYVANDDYDKFLRKVAPESGGIRNLVFKKMKIDCNHWGAKPWPLKDDWHPTAWVVSESRKIIKNTPKDKPLFLTSSFYAPHPPLFPPKKYFDYYYNNKNLPKPAHGDWVDWKTINALPCNGKYGGHRVMLKGERLRAAQAGYYGLIEHLDTEIASLVRDFKARSEAAGRPWVIVVTSDHGEMMGDHGYFRKCEPFEGSANIPFIVAGSSDLKFKAGLRSHQPVCLEDVMPTLLSLGGANIPAVADGVNVVPTLQGKTQTIRPWLHFEHARCYSRPQEYHALSDGRYKYIWRPLDGREHLFNLDKDPKEEHDLSKDASQKATLEKWRVCLVKRLAKRPEGFVKEGKLIAGRPYRPLNKCTPTVG